MNHFVLGIVVALPLGGEGDALSQFAAEGESGIPIVPAQEGIANPGGSGGGNGIVSGGHKRRGGIAAAVGIIGDPVAGFHLGVQGHIGAVNGDGFHPVGQGGLSIPAGDGLVGIHGEGHILDCDRFTAGTLFGCNHTAVFGGVQEEDIVHLLEVSFICIGLPAYKGLCAGEGVPIAVLPAQELIARLFGRGWSYHSCLLALLDGLGGYNCLSILKHIGIHKGFNGLTLIRLN